MTQKPSLSVDKQVELLQDRGLVIADKAECQNFLAAQNYYRFSGYGRYFQRAPHYCDDSYREGATFDEIRSIYDSDAQLREMLSSHLTQAELVLRSHTAHVVANEYGPYEQYLKQNFYSDAPASEPTIESLLRDIERSRERHILRFKTKDHVTGAAKFDELPIWSAVEAWSFGTLSKCIERGDSGALGARVAASLGTAQSGPSQPAMEPLGHRRRPDTEQHPR